jgi:hypothetical protein
MGLIFSGQSLAKIDPKTIEGVWLFDEGAGDVVKDASAKGLNGKLLGGPKWVAGKFGKALEFDGKAAYVEIPKHKNPTNAITVSAWVKSPTATWSQHGFIVSKRDVYIIHPNQGGKLVAFPICNGGCWNKPQNWDTGAKGPTDITQWHMYTGTFDSSTGEWNLYIDGKVVSNLKLDKKPLAEVDKAIWIGRDQCCDPRYGAALIDEVAIFNVALSEADLQTMMNGLSAIGVAVEPAGKITATWAGIKTQY